MRRWLLLVLLGCCWHVVAQQKPFVVMEWNVENLFDTKDDAEKDDDDFTPEGKRHWNAYRYWEKLHGVARMVAAAACDETPPALVGLCEVENDSVLHDLARRSVLRELGYSYVITDGPDRRGINVGLLYQPVLFRPVETRSVRVPSVQYSLSPTRDILYVKGKVSGGDSLHVFVVHLPSKQGGSKGNKNRKLARGVLMQMTDSIVTCDKMAKVLVMGDFNDAKHGLKDFGVPLSGNESGTSKTYCYRGVWQQIDHILFSPALLKKAQKVEALTLSELLEDNKTYGGKMPRRTFRGDSYHGGLSDHLPLVTTITW